MGCTLPPWTSPYVPDGIGGLSGIDSCADSHRILGQGEFRTITIEDADEIIGEDGCQSDIGVSRSPGNMREVYDITSAQDWIILGYWFDVVDIGRPEKFIGKDPFAQCVNVQCCGSRNAYDKGIFSETCDALGVDDVVCAGRRWDCDDKDVYIVDERVKVTRRRAGVCESLAWSERIVRQNRCADGCAPRREA